MPTLSILPNTYTKEQIKLMAAARAKKLVADTATLLVNKQKEGINFVWYRNDGLTAQDVCDALGNTAVKFFMSHVILTNCLTAIATLDGKPNPCKLPKNAFTMNEDGTVTVLEGPYVP